jgi:hypothetical protein
MEFVYLILIIILSLAVKLFTQLKIEQSIFITICSFFIIEFISGLITNLNVGYYIIVSLSVISLIYVSYKAFKRN